MRSAVGTFTPDDPRAGRVFGVTRFLISTSLGDDVDADWFRCRATLAGRPLAPVRGSACRWQLPKNARGKRLRVYISASYKSVSENFQPYTFRVL